MKNIKGGGLYFLVNLIVIQCTACLLIGMLSFTSCKSLKKHKSKSQTEIRQDSLVSGSVTTHENFSREADTFTNTIFMDNSEITMEVTGLAEIQPNGTIVVKDPETVVKTFTRKKETSVVVEKETEKDTTSIVRDSTATTQTKKKEDSTLKTKDVKKKPPYGLYIVLIILSIGLAFVAYKFRDRWLP